MRTATGPALVPAAATVAAQIAYPLLEGDALHVATSAVVVLFCATSLTHAAQVWGAAAAVRLLAVAAGVGLAAEALGVHTGIPFGEYRYTGTLTPQLLGVPVIVPLAWAMMAYPSLVLGRVLAPALAPVVARGRQGATRAAAVALSGGWTLAAWDLFLDPQMVSAGYWRFTVAESGLPGMAPLPAAALADASAVPVGIPWTNHLGWLVVGTLMVAALDAVLPRHPADDAATLLVPAALLVWTWAGSALALAAFLELPAAAAWGAVGMGLTVVPFLLRIGPRASRPASTPRDVPVPEAAS